jgi:uncharacterized protein (TIGR04255 family)
MPQTKLLPNAPLVEVIAEVHWKLPMQALDGAIGHDPRWFDLLAELRPALLAVMPVEETVVAAGVSVPLDVLGRSPIVRFRQSPGGWPLIQLGQGILTINATPPYDGWPRISQVLANALGRAHDASSTFRSLEVDTLKLQYRDAFTGRHGVDSPRQFLSETMPFFPGAVFERVSDLALPDNNLGSSGEVTFALKEPSGSVAAIRHGRGRLTRAEGTEEAAILDFVVTRSIAGRPIDVGTTLEWFEAAHTACSKLFAQIVPQAVMERLRK